ncbi:alpha/beta hydrolase [Arenimonas soli]|uniref:Alpha/beta hydrolase n=1 Tax=Arenimonas soli TaxID=2269504 RepID=A0ABQ1HLR8_9GAMM|nr:alpha/beta fold hydrolase [Arenimonas soli]GGA81269.1 alpha/beta hydrolase [Arenimonas soli]
MKPLHLSLALAALLVPPLGQARTIGQLEFTPCDIAQPGTGATTRLECATLEVPEDPDKPDGRRLGLKVGLAPARSSEPQADMVLFIAGGPGQSATESYPNIAGGFARLREKRHVVFIDQRGTGEGHRLACDFPDELTEVTESDERQVEMARDCLASFDADVAQYTTSVAVTDIEALRQALGAPALNVYGGSYGTRVAQEYARRYPDGVRSLLLDGVVPPGLALGSEHSVNLEASLKAILGRCAGEPACRDAFGDPYRTLYTLRDRARSQPTTVPVPDPRSHAPRELRLDESAVAVIARLFAYAPETAALLPLLLDEAAKGRPQPLLAQAALVYDALSGQINHGMQLSVICAEDAPHLAERDEDAGLILGNAIVGVTLNQCSVWPSGPVSEGFREPLASNVPTLLMSGELDPVTPPRYADEVARTLPRSRHLVGRGQGHILLSRGCTPRLAAEFVDTLDPAGLDADCLEVLDASPFFLDYNGATP